MKQITWLVTLLISANCFGLAKDWQPLYEPVEGAGIPCRVMKPIDFDSEKKYPVIVSLHGAGGKGSDNRKQLKPWNQQLAEKERREQFPCYVVAPQAPGLWNADHLKQIKAVINDLPSVDMNRIYILGHSMGGHGTYIFIQLDPDYFAAAAPSAGSGRKQTEDFIDAAKIKDIPIWAFHGDEDRVCPLEKQQQVFDAVKKLDGNMKLTVWKGDKHGVSDKFIPGADNGTTHHSSNRCDQEPDFMTWLFSHTRTKEKTGAATEEKIVESTLEILDIETSRRTVVYRAKEHFEAPNWTPDGKLLVYNMGGRIYSIPVTGGTPTPIDTGPAIRCNNDHGITTDGKTLIISDNHLGNGSTIYTLPLTGGTPRRVTPPHSYWHGVSPDGKTLAYCAGRNGQYDVYTIPIEGGEETQLTDEPGLDDGPEFSPEGKYIYFNSVRSGMMKIWRMKANGGEPTQMTFGNEYNDWFAHPSPDNRRLVFISYDNKVKPGHHPPNKDVCLRMMPIEGGEPKVVASLFGGQGTINVPSWSPDSKKFAFVSYRLITP